MGNNYLSLHVFSVYTTLHSHTVVQFLYPNNIEVTVNTCTCTDVFTVITTKDQSGGVIAQVARDLWLLVSKYCPWATPAINPW